jgi:hypothetical protein
MKPAELAAKFKADDRKLTNSAVIEFQGQRGIVIKLGENLGGAWLSGDLIVFWDDGENTILPDEFAVIAFDIFAMPSKDDVRNLLTGIDKEESKADEGWWETSEGAKVGASKLAELLKLIHH